MSMLLGLTVLAFAIFAGVRCFLSDQRARRWPWVVIDAVGVLLAVIALMMTTAIYAIS